jgi:putative tricarboxylic transport membrane protein
MTPRMLIFALLVALGAQVAACTRTGEPRRVVTLVTHSSPGGGSDVFLREMAPHLSRIMGETFIVENIQGGSGARAMATLARARPDGRMFYATTPTFIVTSLLSRPAARYTDLEPLVNLFFDPEVIYTAADSKFATLQEVIAHARSGSGKWGAANPASLERQVLEQLKEKAGVAPAVTTFEGGGDMLINVLNHTLDMGVGELQEIRSQLDAGRIRLLAVVGEERLREFPDLQTVREQGIDLAVRKFRGLAGPKGTPPDVIRVWEAAIPRLLADPGYRKIYLANSLQPGFIPHAEYVGFMEKFGKETEAFYKDAGVIE